MSVTHEVRVMWDFEFGIQFTPESLDFVEHGDRVKFISGNAEWSGFNTGKWTNTGNFTGTGTKTVKNSGNGTFNTYIYATLPQGSDAILIKMRAADRTPNSFSLSNKSNLDPKSLSLVNSFTIQGVNSDIPVTATVSNGSRKVYVERRGNPREPDIGTGSSTTYGGNGDVMDIYVEAPFDYGLSQTVTVQAGTVSRSFSMSTRTYPTVDQKIALGVTSPPLDFMNNVVSFFGRLQDDPLMLDYLRGGGLVPSIADNAHVPTSPPLYMDDLLNTYSALYFRFRPPNKRGAADTTSASKTISLTWDMVNDYNVGYGELAKDLQYRYTVNRIDNTGLNLDVIVASGSASSWATGNRTVTLRASSGKYTENTVIGELTIWCRNAQDNSLVISQTVEFQMMFHGP